MSRELADAAERPGATVESLRETAREVMTDALERWGNATASAAVDLFDEVMYAEGIGLDARMPGGIYTRAEIERIARYQAGKLRENRVRDFVDMVAQSTQGLVYHGGDRAMLWQAGLGGGDTRPSRTYGYLLYHSNRSPAQSGTYQVRYARVPQGVETCDFCLMLASRGFVYLTAASAEGWNHTHRNCDCIVVPGVGHYEGRQFVQDTALEGYDVAAMAELWSRWVEITEGDGPGQLSPEALERKLQAMEEIIGRREW